MGGLQIHLICLTLNQVFKNRVERGHFGRAQDLNFQKAPLGDSNNQQRLGIHWMRVGNHWELQRDLPGPFGLEQTRQWNSKSSRKPWLPAPPR